MRQRFGGSARRWRDAVAEKFPLVIVLRLGCMQIDGHDYKSCVFVNLSDLIPYPALSVPNKPMFVMRAVANDCAHEGD